MKKLLVIILVVALALSMVACGDNKTNTGGTNTNTQTNTNTNTETEKKPETNTNTGTETNTGANAVETAALNYFVDFSNNHMISWDDVLAMVDAGDEPFVLSIRQADDYNTEHLKGAYLASFGKDLAEKVSKLPKDKKVYVYCYTGQTSNQAVAVMNMLGIDAYSVNGGVNNGLKKLEGYEKYLESTPNELPDAGASFDAELLAFAQEYFNKIATDGSNIMPVEDIKALVDAGDALVVDVRKADDYNNGHVEGAINIPYGQGMQEKFGDIPKDKKIIVACYTGQTAGQATTVLRALGYDAVSMQGGMRNGWEAKDLPVVK